MSGVKASNQSQSPAYHTALRAQKIQSCECSSVRSYFAPWIRSACADRTGPRCGKLCYGEAASRGVENDA